MLKSFISFLVMTFLIGASGVASAKCAMREINIVDQTLANLGNANAQYKIGVLAAYEASWIFSGNKKGAEDCTIVAFDWLGKSAKKGHRRAQYELAQLYDRGMVLALRDELEAYKWFSITSMRDATDSVDEVGYKNEISKTDVFSALESAKSVERSLTTD